MQYSFKLVRDSKRLESSQTQEDNKLPRPKGSRNKVRNGNGEEMAISPVISKSALDQLSWFKRLNASEQAIVTQRGQHLAHAMVAFGRARLAIGEHLTALQQVLEPHNMFGRCLSLFNFSKRTAYRYIDEYRNAKTALPAPIVEAAMSRGITIVGSTADKPLGNYTEAVKSLPPPVNPTPIQANTWLDQVETVRKQQRTTPAAEVTFEAQDPQTLLKESFKYITSRYNKLPNDNRTRKSWVKRLVGMVLAEFGSEGMRFEPINVPEEFKTKRGRPAGRSEEQEQVAA